MSGNISKKKSNVRSDLDQLLKNMKDEMKNTSDLAESLYELAQDIGENVWNVPDLVKFKGAIELDSDTYTTAKLNAKNSSLFDTLESPLRGMYWYYVKAKTMDGYTQDSSGNPVQSPYYMPWGILIDVPYPFDGENIEQAEQKEGNPNVIPSPVIDDGSSYTRLQRLELMTSPTSEKRRVFVRRLVRTPDALGNYGEPEWEEWKKADAELATKKYVDSKISAELVGVSDENGNEIFNDIHTNTADTINSHVEGSGNNARIGNAHVEGVNNNTTDLFGFKIIAKDNNFEAETRLSTITLDSVEGIEAGMVWNVFENVVTEEETYTEKYRGIVNAVDTETNKVTISSSQSDSEFPIVTELSTYSPLGYFIVNGGIVGSVKIVDRSNEFATHAEGNNNISYFQSHAEGLGVKALGYASHSEGYYTQALGERAHSEGYRTKAQGHESHTEGASTLTTGAYSHAEGSNTQANGEASHVEGRNSKANGRNAHAEGMTTIADGVSSHTEGTSTKAQAENAHAEGFNSIAKGTNSHSEGKRTEANGYCSHAEGESSIADGDRSHAEGSGTKAKHLCSHTEGVGTESSSSYQHVGGTYNVVDDGITGYLEIIGNGTNANNRSNAYTLDKKGNGWFAGAVKVGADAKEVATKAYTDEEIKKVNWNDSAVIEHKGTIDCTDVEYTGSDNPDLQQHYFSDNNILSAEACLKRLSELKFDAISEGAVADGKRYHYWALLKLYPAEFSGSTVCEFIDDRAGIVANDGSYDSGHVRIFIINDNGIRRAFKQEYSFSYNETGSAVYDWTDWERICIGEYDIADSAVTTEKLRNKAVTTAKIADNAITAGKLNDDIFSLAAEKSKAIPHTTAEGQSVKITDQLAGENLLGCKVWGGCGINLFDKNKSPNAAIKNETEFSGYVISMYSVKDTVAMLEPSTKYTVACDIEITSIPDGTVYDITSSNGTIFGLWLYDPNNKGNVELKDNTVTSEMSVGMTLHDVWNITTPADLGAEGTAYRLYASSKTYRKLDGSSGGASLGVIFKNIQFIKGSYTNWNSRLGYTEVGDLNSKTEKYEIPVVSRGINALDISRSNLDGIKNGTVTKAFGGGSWNYAALRHMLKPLTKYTVSYDVEVASAPDYNSYSIDTANNGSWFGFIFYSAKNVSFLTQVLTQGIPNDAAVGFTKRIVQTFTTPPLLHDSAYSFELMAYTKRYKKNGKNVYDNLGVIFRNMQMVEGAYTSSTMPEYEPYTETVATAQLPKQLAKGEYIDLLGKKLYSGDTVTDITVTGELKATDSARNVVIAQTNATPDNMEVEYYQDINKVISEVKNAPYQMKYSNAVSNTVTGTSITVSDALSNDAVSDRIPLDISIKGGLKQVLADSSAAKSPSNIATITGVGESGSISLVINPENKDVRSFSVALPSPLYDLSGQKIAANVKSTKTRDIISTDSILRCTHKVVLDDKFEWDFLGGTRYSGATEFYTPAFDSNTSYPVQNGTCPVVSHMNSYLYGTNSNASNENIWMEITGGGNGRTRILVKPEFLSITDSDTGADKVAKLKNWLTAQKTAGMPVTMVYVMPAPITENFRAPKIDISSTAFTVTNNESAEMELKYSRDINSALDEIRNAVLSLGGNV